MAKILSDFIAVMADYLYSVPGLFVAFIEQWGIILLGAAVILVVFIIYDWIQHKRRAERRLQQRRDRGELLFSAYNSSGRESAVASKVSPDNAAGAETAEKEKSSLLEPVNAQNTDEAADSLIKQQAHEVQPIAGTPADSALTGVNALDCQAESNVLLPEAVQTNLVKGFMGRYFVLNSQTGNTVRDRVETITDMAVSRLFSSVSDPYEVLSRPDIQECLRMMQTGFASTGDYATAQLMVDILLDYSQQPPRTVLNSITGDALATLPKLTWQQIDVLSLLFLLKCTRRSDNSNPERLQSYVTDYLVPFSASIPIEHSFYQHLEYLGCGTIGPVAVTLDRILLDSYPALFQYVGFSKEELDKVMGGRELDPGLLVPSLYRDEQENTYLKLNAIDDELTNQLLVKAGLEPELALELLKLQQARKVDCREDDVNKILPQIHPDLAYLSAVWNKSPMHLTRLSIKGIYIAHANIRRQLGEVFDLSIWIR